MATTTQAPPDMPPAKPQLPLLYRRIEPMSLRQHGDLRLREIDNYSLARQVGLIPITLGEFPVIAKQYPIVFLRPAKGQPPMAVAALGTNPRENLFVGPDGRWLAGFYVPAYLRRYPFITGDTPDQARKAVYVDVESDRVSRDEGTPLYENGELSKAGKAAVEFCGQYHGMAEQTMPFAAALGEAGIFKAQDYPGVAATDARAPRIMIAVDERRLKAVPDATFLEWRAKDWLPAIYLHLSSLGHFTSLANLAKRIAAAGPQVVGNAD